MVGLRQSRSNPRARAFAEALLDGAEHADQTIVEDILVGGLPVELSVLANDPARSLICGAFIPAANRGDKTPTRVSVRRLNERGGHLLEWGWAAPWISACQVIPPAVTSPYRIFIDRNQGLVYCYDPTNNRAVVVLRDQREIDPRSLITPFRVLWSWIASSHKATILHAGAVEIRGQGIIISGPSGSGKSTLSLGGGLRPAGHFIADDCVLIQGTRVQAVFSRAKVDRKTLSDLTSKFSLTTHSLSNTPRAKSYVQLNGDEPWWADSTNISGIVFPVVSSEAGFFSLDTGRSQRILVADSLREVFGGTPQERIRMAQIAGSAPGYRLHLGPDLDENLGLLERIGGELAGL